MLKSLKNKLFIIFLFSLLVCAEITFAEKVKSIKIIGNDRISKETILIFSEIKIGQEIDNIALNNLLKNLYETNYFKFVETSIKNENLTIKVVENPLIGNLNFEGIKAKKILKKIKDNTILKERSSYSDLNLKKDKQTIYKILRELGYYFPKVDLLVENKSNNIINILYKINLGNKTKISKITFNGNSYFKGNKLKSIIVSEEYKFWKFISGRKYLNESNVNFDKKLLKNFYLNQGFYNVEINSSFAKLNKNKNFELTFNIIEGDKFYFDNFDLILPIDYDKNNYSEVLNLFTKYKNKPYSISRIEKLINEIDKISTEEQFVSVNSTVNEKLVDNKINLTFEVAETARVTIKKINFLGNNVTREDVLRNQLEIDEGDPYNDILALKSVNNLKSLNFFKDVTLDVVDIDEGFKEMNISVEEKPTGEIMAGAGVGTSGGTISFGVKENNYLGQGVRLETNLTLTEDSIKGLFSVRNPNYKNSDKSLRVSVQATEIDKLADFGYKTSKTGFSLGTDFEYYDDLNFGIGLNTFYESVEADATASARQKKQVGNYFDIFTNLNFIYDKRDQKFQSTDGTLSRYSIDLPILSDSNTLSNLYTLTNYYQILDQNILKTSIYLKASNSIGSNSIKLSERNYIPSSRLRGFEYGKVGPKDGNDYIGGNYVAAFSFSSSVPQILENTQSTDFSVFLDVANTWGVDYDSSLDTSDDIRSSVGIGLDWFSPIGPVNFTLAQPLSKNNNDVTETFRFNLGTTF